MRSLANRLKILILKYIPIWTIYKLYYYERYLRGLKKCDEKYDFDKEARHFFVFGLSNYGNLGDQAISLAQIKFIQNTFKGRKYQIFYTHVDDFIDKWRWAKRHCCKDDIVFLSGGGNMGDEYPRVEYIRQICVHEFKNNKIIMFPVTADFSESSFGHVLLNNSKRIYSKHKRLSICAREEKSYNLIQNYFRHNKCLLIPDIVLAYPTIDIPLRKNKNKVIFCMREDLEKRLSKETIEYLVNICRDEGFSVEFTDTVLQGNNYYSLKKAQVLVNQLISELATAAVVITDRLHGMLLSSLSSTNCIVFDNYNHKVGGVYRWIEDCAGIEYLNDPGNFRETFKQICSSTYSIDKKAVLKHFEILHDEMIA